MSTGGRYPQPRLLGDVGGTNVRLALETAPGVLGASAALPCAVHPSLEAAIRSFLASHQGPAVRDAAIAIATPIDGDAVRMTNLAWSFSIEAMRKGLRFDTLLLINDFTALAMALPQLADHELRAIGGGIRQPDAVIGLVGPGTGLGVSGLVPCDSRWVPLASEGGHASFAPHDAREAALLAVVARRFAHVSAERLISGPGLVLIHDALRELAGAPPRSLQPAQLAREAQSGQCPFCVETAALFSGMLGGFAGSLALTLGSFGGVYLGGGVIAGLGSAFDRSRFRARFEAKGRFARYLARIATVEIVAELPALRGVSARLAEVLADRASAPG